MSITASFLEAYRFPTAWRGYARSEVDAAWAAATEAVRAYEVAVAELEQRLAEAEASQSAARMVLAAAERTQEEMLASAEEQRRVMVAEAERVLAEARSKAAAELEAARASADEVLRTSQTQAAEHLAAREAAAAEAAERTLAEASDEAKRMVSEAEEEARRLVAEGDVQAAELRTRLPQLRAAVVEIEARLSDLAGATLPGMERVRVLIEEAAADATGELAATASTGLPLAVGSPNGSGALPGQRARTDRVPLTLVDQVPADEPPARWEDSAG